MKPRFIAEWIISQYHDSDGEWIPDRDEYGRSVHPTLEGAKGTAIKRGKNAAAVEWWRVSEEHFDQTLGIPARCDAAWDVVRTWTGDWSGDCDEVADQ